MHLFATIYGLLLLAVDSAFVPLTSHRASTHSVHFVNDNNPLSLPLPVGRPIPFPLHAEPKEDISSSSSDPSDDQEKGKDDSAKTKTATATATATATDSSSGDTDNESPSSPTPKSISDLTKFGFQNSIHMELLEAILSASRQVAMDLFYFLRRNSAYALTASLPEDERDELLERTLGEAKVKAARAKLLQASKDDEDDFAETSLSVQESAVAARAKESKRSQKWEQEKIAIYKLAEDAARERMETELAIQQQRMEQEKKVAQEQAKNAQAQLQQQQEALQKLETEIQQQKSALQQAQQEAQAAATAKDQSALVQQQQDQLAGLEAALKQKEDQAQADQLRLKKLEEQIQSQTQQAKEKPRIHAGRYTPEEYRNLTDEEKEQVKALREQLGPDRLKDDEEEDAASAAKDDTVHPILGPVLQDLGYKRLHLVSAGKLGTIPIWKKQRIYRHERAKKMVEDKWKTMDLGLPGVICLHESPDGKLAILDGQHRVGMMMLLRDKQRKFLQQLEESGGDPKDHAIIDFDNILVEVYLQKAPDNDLHAQEIFLEINKAEPIQLVDLPGVAKSKDRQIITDAVETLQDEYPAMFSPSQQCRVPNVNADNLRNSLFGSGVLKKHKLTTSKKIVTWVLEQNDLLKEKYNNDEEAQAAINPKALKKANDNQFYLGLESSWLYN